VIDVLLAHGYFLEADPVERHVMRPHPPLGLLYLASHLRAQGIPVGVFDGTFQSRRDFTARLASDRPAIVGLAANLMTKRTVLAMIAEARAAGAWVVVGGPDPPAYAEQYLGAGAHVVVIGEGENTLRELVPVLTAGGRADDLGAIPGLAFLDGRRVVRTPPRELLSDLDGQPWPDREAVDLSQYLSAWRARHGQGALSLITARGCPYSCTWCSRSVFGVSHRRRAPEAVADEVAHLVDRYAPDRLWYADDVFTIHRSWLLRYAGEMDRRRLRLPFECISRAERIDEDVARALVSLGCDRLWIGSESGSQQVLDAMERRVTVERVQEATAVLQRHGISVGMFIMLGYDGETVDDLRATIRHLKRARPDVFLTTVAYPIKGTPFYERVASRVRSPGAWDTTTDRDLRIAGRPRRRYYDFARRWIVGEVDRAAHWQAGRYLQAVRSAASATTGRLGMAMTAAMVER
jgi:radical SAM superfamily enzyme YgiQ (UPF0313 family)